MAEAEVEQELTKIGAIIGSKMADPDIFGWLDRKTAPSDTEIHRAATIVADRLCGAVANAIIRNVRKKHQLAAIKAWLEACGYGGGMFKLEPKELANVDAAAIAELIPDLRVEEKAEQMVMFG